MGFQGPPKTGEEIQLSRPDAPGNPHNLCIAPWRAWITCPRKWRTARFCHTKQSCRSFGMELEWFYLDLVRSVRVVATNIPGAGLQIAKHSNSCKRPWREVKVRVVILASAWKILHRVPSWGCGDQRMCIPGLSWNFLSSARIMIEQEREGAITSYAAPDKGNWLERISRIMHIWRQAEDMLWMSLMRFTITDDQDGFIYSIILE